MADPGLLQLQMKRNTEDLQDYLRDLGNWEDEIKKKDAMLHKQKPVLKKKLPPVRNELLSDKQKRRRNKRRTAQSRKPEDSSKSARIKSFDYSAWENFNVDSACAEVDCEAGSSSSSELSEEEDEEVELERRKQLAVLEKEKGNSLFKEGKHEAAVERYTRGMDLDPSNAVLPANRAMALLKLRRYGAAEQDCSLALALDSSYIKAWLRRATVRALLNKLQPAIDDYNQVLKLDQNNRQAKTELEKLQQKLKTQQQREQEKKEKQQEVVQHQVVQPSGPQYVHAVKRSQHLRSKKPMRRILIEEVGEKREEEGSNGVQSSSRAAVECVESTGSEAGVPDKNDAVVQEDEAVVPSSSENQPVIPPVAINSIELQTHWKSLRKNKQCLTQYFQAIPPSQYPVLLQQSLETDAFSDILSILEQNYIFSGRSCMEELSWLTKVKRFEMAVMFLSKSDKQVLGRVFSGLKELLSSEHYQELSELAKKYSTNL